jgi:hypothetical protein
MVGAMAARAGVEADPNKDYPITPDVGQWVICSASYSGEGAAKMAHDLILEIRAQYGLPAYVFNRGAELRRQQEEELQKRRQQQQEALQKLGLTSDTPIRQRKVRIEDQYAVLIGGFAEIEAARRELDRIKKMKAPKTVPADYFTFDPIKREGDAQKVAAQRTPVNPFSRSFVVRNPTVPIAQEPAKKWDPFWVKLNAGEDFSLLKCPKAYTLLIKVYSGGCVVQPDRAPTPFLEKLFGRHGDELGAAAMNAHNMAETLRKIGFDAYVLHTRTSSMLTVGAFDGPSDPRIVQVQHAVYDGLKRKSMQPGTEDPNKLDWMAQPVPMEVPRFDDKN